MKLRFARIGVKVNSTKYTVSVAIDGRIDINVEADSFEDAKSKISLIDIDLRNMECVGFRAVNAEDENGVFEDY